MEYTLEYALRHAGKKSQIAREDITEMIHEEMPEYLWIDIMLDDPKEREMHCGRCGDGWMERKTGRKWPTDCRQGEECRCPKCNSPVIAKYMSRGRDITDRLNAVWYKKSEVDPNIVVAIAAHCRREYRFEETPWRMETDISIRGIEIFEYGVGWVRWQTHPVWPEDDSQWRAFTSPEVEWRRVKALGELAFHDSGGIMQYPAKRMMFVETLEDAIRGTPFERAWSESYCMLDHWKDTTTAMALIAKYPCIEYLTKMGMTGFLRERIMGNLPSGTIYWNGKSAEKVLRLPKRILGEMKAEKITLTPALQQVLVWCEKNEIRLTVRCAEYIVKTMAAKSTAEVSVAMECATEFHAQNRRKKALKYIAKIAEQCERERNQRAHIEDFIDYWRQCAALNDNMNDDDTAFPRNFFERHGRMDQRMKYMKDKEKDKLIQARWDKLNDFLGFTYGGLVLRPARSSEEVIREGETLHHCVGGYVERYAAGGTVICVLRRMVEPETPWRTVEITPNGRVVQDRGWKNDLGGIALDGSYKAALEMFWEAWRERETKGRKSA